MTYRVVHRTEYTYDSPVTSSYGELYVLPRNAPGQVCHSSSVRIEPAPHDYRERVDFFGNRAAYFAVLEPHTKLTVTAESVVDVRRPGSLLLPVDQAWETVRDRLHIDPADDAYEAREFLLRSPKIVVTRDVVEYASRSFPPGRPLTEALVALTSQIYDDFTYEPGSTTVRTTLTELLERREGVCQDFAHLAVGCLRSVGLAARYVSGYLETVPPPGKPRLVGADVSHAWASVFVPDAGWVDLDPTNNRFVSDRYVTNAFGRDYGDVSPLKGVIYTESTKQDLHVSVDVAPLDHGALIRVHVGCEFVYEAPTLTPTVWQVRPRADPGQRLTEEVWSAEPGLPRTSYHDHYGNVCDRVTLPTGRSLVRYDAQVEVSGLADDVDPSARQIPVESLPDDAMVFLLPSRFCVSDLLRDHTWELFGATEPGWARVVAVCDWVHENVTFQAGSSNPFTTALDVWDSRAGVCRDFAQLGLTLCRSLNIPARYVFGYLPDIGIDPPYEPQDFCAWIEVYLEHRWWTFDPRNNMPRIGRVVIGRGRDALDVAMVTAYGAPWLQSMTVWADEVDGLISSESP